MSTTDPFAGVLHDEDRSAEAEETYRKHLAYQPPPVPTIRLPAELVQEIVNYLASNGTYRQTFELIHRIQAEVVTDG